MQFTQQEFLTVAQAIASDKDTSLDCVLDLMVLALSAHVPAAQANPLICKLNELSTQVQEAEDAVLGYAWEEMAERESFSFPELEAAA